jgi:hypothetical protein
MPRIDELRERLNRKHAYDYEIARSLVSETSTDELETKLAEVEKQLPRWGETVVADDIREGMDTGPMVILNNDPPKEERYSVKDYWGSMVWKDNGGKVWWYNDDDGDWISWLNLVAYVRAIRDELSERLDREATHLAIGYDS